MQKKETEPGKDVFQTRVNFKKVPISKTALTVLSNIAKRKKQAAA